MEELHRNEPHESRRPNENYRVSVTVGLSPALEALAERYVAAIEDRRITQQKVDALTERVEALTAGLQAAQSSQPQPAS